MPGRELLSILGITCDEIGEHHESRKFDSQTIEASYSPSCRLNEAIKTETDRMGMHDGKINMPDYFWSSAGDKRVSEI